MSPRDNAGPTDPDRRLERLIDEGLETLADPRTEVSREEQAARDKVFAELSARLDQPGIQDKILQRYGDFGRTLLADSTPSAVDPAIARAVRPYLGDVADVRVHTGRLATEAAQAMDARAFAIGDRDIFIDATDFAPGTKEGGALLAHEIAHTRDASTGFALSRRYGTETAAREAFAEQVEMLFALEYESESSDIVGGPTETPNPVGGNGMPVEAEVDREQLARKIFEIMQTQREVLMERTGGWN
jgi:hypothetical protein